MAGMLTPVMLPVSGSQNRVCKQKPDTPNKRYSSAIRRTHCGCALFYIPIMDRPLIWKARALDNAAESKAEGELIGETRGIEKGKASTSLCVAAVLSAFFAAGVSAQNMDTAYVPFRVNVDATATAQLAGGEKFEKLVRAGSTDTLHIISESTTPISMGKTPRPVAMHSSRGKISLELSRQLYKGVDIAIYSLNGKQIMHVKADASEVLKSISHPNVRMGVYVL